MKNFRHKKLGLRILLTLAFVTSVRAQDFQNLDFESANVPVVPPGQSVALSLSQGLPGWSGYAGTNAVNYMYYNGVSVGSALITLISPTTANFGLSNAAIEGNFTVTIDAGINPFGGGSFVSAGIGQIGTIPAGSQSLLFDASISGSSPDFEVSFNGQVLPYIFMEAGSNYTTYGADISALAGASGDLRFTEHPPSSGFGIVYLDNIQFSSVGIPEPSTLSLFGLGLLGLVWHRRRNVRVRS